MLKSYIDYNCLTVRLALVGFYHFELMSKSYIDFNCLTIRLALEGFHHVKLCRYHTMILTV